MEVLIVYPEKADVVTGNSCSAEQWGEVLLALGHEVVIGGSCGHRQADLLIALNAEKMQPEIDAFSRSHPGSKIVVILTGTDIYPALSDASVGSIRAADCLVALQSKAIHQIPDEFHHKLRIIVQSVIPSRPGSKGKVRGETFNAAIVANLREVKDPFRAAAAVKLMPGESRILIRHAGFPLQPGTDELARQETSENSRYEWIGGLNPAEARELIAESDVLLVTSSNEGAGRVVGEAITDGTPVIATRVEGITGLVGDDYGGLFPVGDTAALAALLTRAESEQGFLDELSRNCREIAPIFEPIKEMDAWRELIAGLS
ncbi:MAG: glycosyltransferase [Verrucomicrobiales bacterium]